MLINLPTHNFKIFALKPFLNRFYTPSGQKSGLDQKTAVFCGPGPGFGRSGSRADRLESRSFQKRQKDRTGPDLRTLGIVTVLQTILGNFFFFIEFFFELIIPTTTTE